MEPGADPVDTVVQSLLRVHRGGPLADDAALEGLITSEAQAYAVQDRLLETIEGNAAGARHWKSGAPTRADAPKHAPLPSGRVRNTGADVSDLRLRHHWIEAEVALRIGREITPQQARQIAHEDASALIDGMCVSIELLDSRWRGARNAAPLLKQADLLMHGALVLGDFAPFEARAWGQQTCQVRIGSNDEKVYVGTLGIVDPAWVLPAWIRHATRNGAAIRAGTVVSTGTWCGVLEAPAGARVTVAFPGIGAATVQL